jgi:hypothetical protein
MPVTFFYFSYGLPSNAGGASVLRGSRDPVFQTMNDHLQEAAEEYFNPWTFSTEMMIIGDNEIRICISMLV